jgi:hypothetical protein
MPLKNARAIALSDESERDRSRSQDPGEVSELLRLVSRQR